MSICCHECGSDLAPSETFPGREGGVIIPNVLSVVWTPDEDWVTAFVEAPQHLACCFECITKKLQNPSGLQPVYDTYEAEIAYSRFERKKNTGMMAAVEFGRQVDQSGQLFNAFQEKKKAIPNKSCLMCTATLPVQERPYFIFRVTDKAYCEQNLSLFFNAYQVSDYKQGMTQFGICFNCVKLCFPRIFKQLSYDLRGTGESNFDEVSDTRIHLSPEVLKKLYGMGSN